MIWIGNLLVPHHILKLRKVRLSKVRCVSASFGILLRTAPNLLRHPVAQWLVLSAEAALAPQSLATQFGLESVFCCCHC